MGLSKPIFLQLEKVTNFDYSCERSAYIRINPSNGNQQANLNTGNDLTFAYDGANKLYRLADPESGFIAKIGFRTRTNVATDAAANITLANNWFGHLFTQASFQLGNTLMETYTDVGTVMDVLDHLKPREYRTSGGEGSGFIPDTGSGAATQTLVAPAAVAVGNPADATVATIAASMNTGADKCS